MKKSLFFLLAGVFLVACTGKTTTANTHKEGTPDSLKTAPNKVTAKDWSFEEISKIVLEVYPEAYAELMEITFEEVAAGVIFPSKAEFLIPDARFSQIPGEDFNARERIMLEKLGVGGCPGSDVSDPMTFSYAKWPDKNVRRITLYFGIGC